MTCIVGIKVEGEGVYIGGDRIGVAGTHKESYKRPKVFKNGNIIFGVGGCFRTMQVLEFNFTVPDKKEHQSDDNFIYTTLLDSMLACLKNSGVDINDPPYKVILGYKGRLFTFQDSFILEPINNYTAIGSGIYCAGASLYSTKNTNLSPKERIKLALESANDIMTNVDNNIDIVFQEYRSMELSND